MKTQLFIIVSLFISSFCAAQRFGISMNAGYNAGIANQNITYKTNYTPYQSSQEVVRGSFGRGINLFTSLTYKKDSIFNFELGFFVNQSPAFNGVTIQDTSYKYSMDASAWMLRVLPALKVYFYRNKWRYYFKVFPVVRLAGWITAKTTNEDLINHIVTKTELRYSHGLSVGAGATLGLEKKISNSVKFTCEAVFIAQSWAPKNADVISYSVNGEDQFNTLYTSQKHIHFSRKFNKGAYSSYKFSPQPSQFFPFSSVGLNIGFAFTLNRKRN